MEELWNKIYITFIMQDRYQFFLDGLKTSLLLIFSSFILGTLVGISMKGEFLDKDGRLPRARHALMM